MSYITTTFLPLVSTSISYASYSLDEMQYAINSELENLNNWPLAKYKLSLNIAKTEFMIIGSRQRINVIGDREINRVDFIKSLGVHIDSNLSWSEHIDKISKKFFQQTI